MIRSGLVALRDAVAEAFATSREQFHGAIVIAPIGRRAYASWLKTQPQGAGRVCFLQPENGDRGTLTKANAGRGRDERPVLFEWHRPVTLSVWASDPYGLSAEDEEQRALDAAEGLFELTLQAIRRAVHPDTRQPIFFANLEFSKVREVVQNHVYSGVELQADFVLRGPLFDAEPPIFKPAPSVARVSGVNAPVPPGPFSPVVPSP